MNLTLARGIYDTDGTLGTILANGQIFYTIEQPWDNNEADHSCVPAGTYELIPYNSPTHGPTWQLHNPELNVYGEGVVPTGGRDYIEIHADNVASTLEGCIGLGTSTGTLPDPTTGQEVSAVLNSRVAVASFVKLLGPMSTGHTLTITGDF